jgi:hypothetical protein
MGLFVNPVTIGVKDPTPKDNGSTNKVRVGREGNLYPCKYLAQDTNDDYNRPFNYHSEGRLCKKIVV